MIAAKGLLASAAFCSGAKFLSRIIGLISTLILARILTPTDFAMIAIIAIVLHLFDILSHTGSEQYIVQKSEVLAGDLNTGQVIGETSKYGEEPARRPVKFQEVFATLYHKLGLDAHRDRVFDGSGTPRYPVDAGIEPIAELL